MGLFDFFKKKSKKDELIEARQKVTTELKEAEKSFLQHKIDKSTFDSISRERNSDLIRIEAEIDLQKHRELPKEDLIIAQKVSADKRRVVLGLLNEKQKKVYEIKIAENSYLKRKISDEVYQKISSEVKKEMISIDAQIKAILESEAISRLKDELKSGGAEIAKQQKLSNARQREDFMQEIEDDIFEQSMNMNLGENQQNGDSKKQENKSAQRDNADKYSENNAGAYADNDYGTYSDSQSYSENKNIPRRLRKRGR